MTQEQFEAIGIEKSLAKKAAEASKKELEGVCIKRYIRPDGAAA